MNYFYFEADDIFTTRFPACNVCNFLRAPVNIGSYKISTPALPALLMTMIFLEQKTMIIGSVLEVKYWEHVLSVVICGMYTTLIKNYTLQVLDYVNLSVMSDFFLLRNFLKFTGESICFVCTAALFYVNRWYT